MNEDPLVNGQDKNIELTVAWALGFFLYRKLLYLSKFTIDRCITWRVSVTLSLSEHTRKSIPRTFTGFGSHDLIKRLIEKLTQGHSSVPTLL